MHGPYTTTPPFHISSAAVTSRALRARVVVVDCDGSLTDGRVFYSAEGAALRSFSARDELAVELLAAAGVDTVLLAREASENAARWGEAMRLPYTLLGVRDKLERLPDILAATGAEQAELAYFGDDLDDLPIMRALIRQSLVGCPADAHATVRELAHFVSQRAGGAGAFRTFAEWILAWRG